MEQLQRTRHEADSQQQQGTPPLSGSRAPPPMIKGEGRLCRDYNLKGPSILSGHWRMEHTVKCPRTSSEFRQCDSS
jgi:hypothetical protein